MVDLYILGGCSAVILICLVTMLIYDWYQERREYVRHLEEACARWQRLYLELRAYLQEFPEQSQDSLD